MAHKEKRIDVRVYLTPDEHEYLKAVSQENDVSLSELLRVCTLKKCKFAKAKKVRQKIALPSTAESTAVDCPTPELTREQVQKRLTEIDEYIKAEQAELQEWKEN